MRGTTRIRRGEKHFPVTIRQPDLRINELRAHTQVSWNWLENDCVNWKGERREVYNIREGQKYVWLQLIYSQPSIRRSPNHDRQQWATRTGREKDLNLQSTERRNDQQQHQEQHSVIIWSVITHQLVLILFTFDSASSPHPPLVLRFNVSMITNT